MTAVRRKFSEASKDHYRIAIHGLGGVGKTQFALEYLYRYRSYYDYCFWINGAERTTIISELGLVAENLNFTPSRKNLTPIENARELLRWLPQVPRWLLVIDNLDDMKVLQDLVPSGTTTGHVLITTRSANLRGLPAYTFEVPVLSAEEATQMLVRRAMPDISQADITQDITLEAKQIAQDLGCLPLAIEQASGYIRESFHGILGFRSIYQSNQKRILDRTVSLDYPKSVSTTWLISLEDIRNRSPHALELLTLFAFLNPDDILVEFLQAGKETLDEGLRNLITDPGVFDESLALLSNFSLIQCFKQKKNVAIHRLVQIVVKNSLNPAELRQWRNKTLELSSAAFPPVRQKDISLHRRFRSQVMACIKDPDMEQSVLMADLLSRTGWYLDCECQFGDSQPLYERAIEIYRQAEGEDSSDLMINMDRLGWNSMRQGHMTEAANMYQDLFSRMCTIQGEDHDDTLACQRNYGVALLKDGRYDQGIVMLEQACEKQRSILGDDNPRTHSTMRKVADAYMQQGKLDDAIELLEIVYSSSKSDPRGTFNSVQCDLGWAYCLKNRLSEGISLLENARRLQANSLGEENMDTLRSARHLACAYVLQGNLIQGTGLLERTCESQKKQLGIDNEETLLTMRYLVGVYESQGLQMNPKAFELGDILKKRGLKPICLPL